MFGSRRIAALLLVTPLLAFPSPAESDNQCHVVDVDFFPAESPNPVGMRFPVQMVMWVEDTNGTYVDTIYITQQAGTFGLGNRPGRFDFNSGPRWPYGRRATLFPVWAHRHGLMFPEVEFQNADDDNLSHPFSDSSREVHYCRPMQRTEPTWDAATCASAAFTDKGVLSPTKKSLYPPRNDVARATTDSPSVEMYDALNPFDAVSMATPPSNQAAEISWPIPPTMTPGNYVMFVEVAREFDQNTDYNFPAPPLSAWGDYGEPYRGQPSVVYKVPFTIGPGELTSTTKDYVGYGDPDGIDGNLRAPDATITTTTDGSGAGRLAIRSDGGTDYRVRVISRNEDDQIAPAAPGGAQLTGSTGTKASFSFTAPGDDGVTGRVKGYEVRYRVGPASGGEDMTDANFTDALLTTTTVAVDDPGSVTKFDIDGLLPDTEYSVGIRALDDCRNTGPLAIVKFRTADRTSGQVDACFVATAAYGSLMANDVEPLRRFRDTFLRQTALGELAVEAYYAFGPGVAGVVGESDLLRATARTALDPVVKRVKNLRF